MSCLATALLVLATPCLSSLLPSLHEMVRDLEALALGTDILAVLAQGPGSMGALDMEALDLRALDSGKNVSSDCSKGIGALTEGVKQDRSVKESLNGLLLNKNYQMMVDPMFMIVQNSRLFLVAVTPTAVDTNCRY